MIAFPFPVYDLYAFLGVLEIWSGGMVWTMHMVGGKWVRIIKYVRDGQKRFSTFCHLGF